MTQLDGAIGMISARYSLESFFERCLEAAMEVGVGSAAVHDDPLATIHLRQIHSNLGNVLVGIVGLGRLPAAAPKIELTNINREPSLMDGIASIHHRTRMESRIDSAHGQHTGGHALLALVQLPTEAHGKHEVLNLAGVVHALGQSSIVGSHPHDSIGKLFDEQSCFASLAPKGKVDGVRSIDWVVPGIGLIATTEELILHLIGMPRAALGVGLAELALVTSARCTGLAFRAGERMKRRGLGPIEVVVSMVRFSAVGTLLARKGRVV
mmetsp:Transcript_15815/g.45550  ORF Transcript_15815/g.45550 Transcript_15815/m.45550 type:complete len:267 (+) Transcript_15815:2146-2946(+)